MNNKFTTKEEYLIYRSEWKVKYNELSNKIRGAVRSRKQYQKAWSKAEKECKTPNVYSDPQKIYKVQKEILKNDPIYQALWRLYNPTNYQYWCYPDREKLRKEAFAMLEELKEAKQEAQRQYEEQNKLLTVS